MASSTINGRKGPKLDTTTKRRYSRRVLRGRVSTTWSTRVGYPKLHVDATCEALENTPEEARGVELMSALQIAGCDWGRPCRMCSLESVLNTLLDPKHHAAGTEMTFVSFTSQSNPLSPDQPGGPWSYAWHESTDSGKQRLVRVAQRAGLEISQTLCGPVAYGFVPADVVGALSHNLRSLHRPEVVELPDAAVIACVWALLGDNPPEIDLDNEGLDAWDIATKLVDPN
jgi:hypothetical protein